MRALRSRPWTAAPARAAARAEGGGAGTAKARPRRRRGSRGCRAHRVGRPSPAAIAASGSELPFAVRRSRAPWRLQQPLLRYCWGVQWLLPLKSVGSREPRQLRPLDASTIPWPAAPIATLNCETPGAAAISTVIAMLLRGPARLSLCEAASGRQPQRVHSSLACWSSGPRRLQHLKAYDGRRLADASFVGCAQARRCWSGRAG